MCDCNDENCDCDHDLYYGDYSCGPSLFVLPFLLIALFFKGIVLFVLGLIEIGQLIGKFFDKRKAAKEQLHDKIKHKGCA